LLRKAGVPVPEVFRAFRQNGACYLVLEKIGGRQLFPRGAMQPRTISWCRAAKFLERLEPVLDDIHAAGWVWRDGKPSHIFLERGAVRLIDFEGACRIDETEVLTWGSANYLPRVYYDSFNRRPGVFEDRHALGVIAFQFGTGKFPPEKSRQRAAIYRTTRCPNRLRERIDTLLDSKSGERRVK
jgi:serine/threonine protein kinase